MSDMAFAEKGRKEPLSGLMQQAKVQIALAKQHAKELEERGWTAADTAELEKWCAELNTQFAAKVEARDQSRGATASEHAAIGAAKQLIYEIRNAAPLALRGSKLEGVTIESFEAGLRLGRSTPKISRYLLKIRPAVLALDEQLKRYFKGQKASELLDAAKKALDEADVSQETKLADLPKDTLAVYEAKGHVLQLIEDLNRCAKVAFYGKAETVAKFNKDILLRARRSRPKAAPTPPTPSPTPS
jgi:hypothetical protein